MLGTKTPLNESLPARRELDIYSGWEYGDLENPTEQNKGSG